MGKSTLKFVNAIFVLALIAASCSGKEMPKEKKVKPSVTQQSEPEEKIDTVWMPEEITPYDSHSWSMDTSFIINGEQHVFNISVRPKRKEMEQTYSWRRNDTLFAKKLIGPQCEISLVANTMQDHCTLSILLDKEDLLSEDNAAYLVADNSMTFDFMGYHKEFDAILLRSYMGYPSSDDGIVEYIFLGMDGKIKKRITDGHFFDVCDNDPMPSPDGHTISFCKGILHSDYRLISVERDTPLAGIFQLGDKFSLVIYMYEGKPPYSNMKLLSRTGTVLKSFSFEGIGGDMSYEINHCRIDNDERLVLVDDIKRQLFVFNQENPYQPAILNFDDLKDAREIVMMEGERFHFWSTREEFDLFYLDGEFLFIN